MAIPIPLEAPVMRTIIGVSSSQTHSGVLQDKARRAAREWERGRLARPFAAKMAALVPDKRDDVGSI